MQNIGPSIKPIEHQEKQFSSIRDQLNQLEELNNFNKESRETGQLTLDRFNLTTSLINKINDLKIELIKNNILPEELQSTINEQINKQKKILYNLFEARQAVDDNNEPMPGVIYITYDAKPSRFDFIFGKRRTITITDPLWKIGSSIEKITIERAFDLAFQELEAVEESVPMIFKQYIDEAKKLDNLDLINVLDLSKQTIIQTIINQIKELESSRGASFSQKHRKNIFKKSLLNQKFVSIMSNELNLIKTGYLVFQELETEEESAPMIVKQYIDEAKLLNNLDLINALNLIKEEFIQTIIKLIKNDESLKGAPFPQEHRKRIFRSTLLNKTSVSTIRTQLNLKRLSKAFDLAFQELEAVEESAPGVLKQYVDESRKLNNLDLVNELNLIKEDIKGSLTRVSTDDLEELTKFLKDYSWVEIVNDFKDKILKISQTKFKEQLSFLTYIDLAFKDLELEENSSLWYLKEKIEKARSSGDLKQVKELEKKYYDDKKMIIPSIKKVIEKREMGILGERKILSLEEVKDIITQELEKLFKQRTD